MQTRRCRRFSVLFVAALVALVLGPTAMLAPAVVLAQDTITISELNVALWPEYDKAGVLVIYTGSLSPDVQLPADVTFAMPADAGKPAATAGIDAQGNYRYRQYEAVVEGDTLFVSYSLPYRSFQFEYYYDPLGGQGVDRQFDFTYRADYTVDSLTLEIQEPSGSTDFSTNPPADGRTVEGLLPLNQIGMGSLAAGEVAGVTVSYRKESTALSVEVLGLPTPSAVEFEDAPREGGSQSLLIIALVTVIVIGVVVGLVIWSRNRQQAPMNRQARRQAARKSGARTADKPSRKPAPGRMTDGSDAPPVTGYCHQCGRALKADERFCPGCGVPRRE